MNNSSETFQLSFVGLSGYAYPHTRVRCFHFAKALEEYPDVETKVLSYRDHLCPKRTEVDMFDHAVLRDWHKLALVGKAFNRLRKDDPRTIMYVQKAHFHSAAPYVLHKLFKRKFIFDYDDYDVDLSVFFGRGTFNRLFFGTHDWGKITEKMARESVACVASSHYLLDFLKEFNPRTYLVQTGVDVDQFKPLAEGETRTENRTVFLWTGLVWGEEVLQSVCQVLEAFKCVASVVPEVTMLIVGGGQRMGELEELVRKECGSLDIRFLGWRAPVEMPDILRQADVGLLPFHEDTRWIRSKSPTKLFEYMASGLSVIATGFGEVCHVIDDQQNGFLVKGTEEFAERMIQIAKDRDLRNRIGNAARDKVVDNYSLSGLAEKLHNMLLELRAEGIV